MAVSKIENGNKALLYDGNIVNTAGTYIEIPISNFSGYRELEIVQIWNGASQGTVFLEVASGRATGQVITYAVTNGTVFAIYLDARFNSTSGKLEVRFRQNGYTSTDITLTKTRVFGIK